jgi:hypothetical protein
MENISQNSWPSGLEIEQGPPDYEAGVLIRRWRFPVLSQVVKLELMQTKRRRVSLLTTAF